MDSAKYYGPTILEGQKITGMELAQDKKALRFIVEGRLPITFLADGDCRSSTWIEHIEGVERLIGGTVSKVEEIPMPNLGSAGYESLAYYGLRIDTDKGSAVIDYRNESNGYYGGSLICIEGENSYYHGGVYGQNKSEDKFEPITESM